MNLLDIVIAVFCIGFTGSGLLKGLVRQAAGWAGLILGHIAGVNFYAGVDFEKEKSPRVGRLMRSKRDCFLVSVWKE